MHIKCKECNKRVEVVEGACGNCGSVFTDKEMMGGLTAEVARLQQRPPQVVREAKRSWFGSQQCSIVIIAAACWFLNYKISEQDKRLKDVEKVIAEAIAESLQGATYNQNR